MGIFTLTRKHAHLPVEIRPEYKRKDQQDITTMRLDSPDMVVVLDDFLPIRMGLKRLLDKPGFTDIDAALMRSTWCIEEDTVGFGPVGAVGNQGLYAWEGEIYPQRAEFDNPLNASQVVKQAARFMGASLVGIADYDERWVYTHSFNPITREHKPVIFPFEPRSVIVMAIEMAYDNYRTSPSFISSAATGHGYGQMAVVTHRMATFIRALGYQAVPCGNDTAMSVPLGLQAGLGEMSRLGLLITPEYGPRVRLCKVFTDLPLQADQPITFGVVEFCKQCMKCAEACPVKAISRDPEPSFRVAGPANNPGVKKWYNRLEPCIKYWAYRVDCSACLASCPYNKPNDWVHQIGLRVAQTPAKGLLRRLDDRMGYGKAFDQKAMLQWWCDRPKRASAVLVQSRDTGPLDLPETATPAEAFAALSDKFNRHPEKLAGMNVVLQFSLTGENGGEWFVSVVNGQAEIAQGEKPSPNCTLAMQDRNFLLLVSGKLNPPSALMSGKISVRGDMSQVLKMKKLFS